MINRNLIPELFEERIVRIMSVPDIERMYECGDVLANAKGLTHKAVKEFASVDNKNYESV